MAKNKSPNFKEVLDKQVLQNHVDNIYEVAPHNYEVEVVITGDEGEKSRDIDLKIGDFKFILECKTDYKLNKTDNFCLEIISNVPKSLLPKDGKPSVYKEGTQDWEELNELTLNLVKKNYYLSLLTLPSLPLTSTDEHLLSYMEYAEGYSNFYYFDINRLQRRFFKMWWGKRFDLLVARNEDNVTDAITSVSILVPRKWMEDEMVTISGLIWDLELDKIYRKES